ncbi:glycosyltransferase family 2 protein [Paenibacillus sp. MBLB4367]|uniref:glycosyltransferase family 2 protein n=1 Tax=Paenibacillus sp. MBLB4367 TaxID=3384767 RepID=UPI003907FCD2
MPKVTVLMPVYNGERYLRESIESILNQTFTDFKFLIINDGSTDKSVEIIEEYKDSRIQLIHNSNNIGLIATLNKGLDLSEGDYIARMDCDDISLPRRLEIQVNFMDNNNDISVCGTGIEIIGHKSFSPYIVSNYNKIKNYLVVDDCITHPTAVLRTAVIKENQYYFDKNYVHAEDYEYFQRISEKYKIENLNEILLQYRLSPEGISRKFVLDQLNMAARISTEALLRRGIPFERQPYIKLSLERQEIREAKGKIEDLKLLCNLDNDIKEIIRFLWLDICNRGTYHGWWAFKELYSIKKVNMLGLNIKMQFRFLIKCLIKRKLSR